MAKAMDIEAFLAKFRTNEIPILDVRAPKEYEKGHIPGAQNVPLFENEERHIVGIQYKQLGREQAIMKGLELVGPKLAQFVREAQSLSAEKELLVHCWRGGMRSQSMAWLWETSGFEVGLLEGGYKAYRRKVRVDLAQPLQLIVLGGKSGSGKTALLHALRERGEQVIDLEGLANHKGSAFGAIGLGEQPSVEQFENDLHQTVQRLDVKRRIWVEDESNAIGRVYIPQTFWRQMQGAPIVMAEVSREERISRLVEDYTGYGDEVLEQALLRLHKRLGGNQLQRALNALSTKDYETTASIVLRYYDKAYGHSLKRKHTQSIYPISLTLNDLSFSANRLVEHCQTHISLHDRFGYDQTDTV